MGCGFDLGVLLEKGYTNSHDAHTHTRVCVHTDAPCGAEQEADARWLVFLHFPRFPSCEIFNQGSCYLDPHLEPSSLRRRSKAP